MPDIVAILECTKRTESGMWTFFQINAPQNKEENLDPHNPKVIFLGTPGKQDYADQAALKKLSDLEGPTEDPDNQGVLTYIKKLATYVSDLEANLLGFTRDAEASDLVWGEYLDRIHIQTKAVHGRLGQDKDMEQEDGSI